MNLENQVKASMEAAFEHLREELKSLRTSRANPSILDQVQVDAYGTTMRLKEVANVTAPEARQLLVTPFDTSLLPAIVKGIENANLNLQPKVDKNVIRINIPPMDESIRKETARQCKRKGEEAKVTVRDVRRKHNEIVRKQKADGLIPEDLVKKQEKMIQDFTDQYCKKIDTLCLEKEKEILAI